MRMLLVFLIFTVFTTGCGGKKTAIQLTMPDAGEEIALVKTNMGEFKIRFFPQYAPKACENFITLAKEGYYDNLTFHRVMKNMLVQGGDPTATGYGGDSKWGEAFENEITTELRNIRGAVAMANAGPDTNTSQFYVVQGGEIDEKTMDFIRNPNKTYKTNEAGRKISYAEDQYADYYTIYKPLFPSYIADAYAEVGGQPRWDFAYTVFGQVIEGMDTVDKISAVSADERTRKPFEDVIIESVVIIPYE